VASAPSCLLALAREQPRFFPGSEGDRLAEASAGLFTYLGRILGEGGTELRPVPLRVVYQTPCHGSVLGTSKDEVAVLRAIPGLEVMDVTEECCGLSGSFGAEARHAALSDAIALPLVERIKRSAPEAVVTPCGSCKTQDEAHLGGVPVVHPLELLARALGLDVGRQTRDARRGT
jgi:glycerol-3-phosphate dehydrogenase subunit C